MPSSPEERRLTAYRIAVKRDWGNLETDALAKAYFDSAIACMIDLQEELGSFRNGVRAAIQAAVDDLAELAKRRDSVGVNKDHTAVIRGIAKRIATVAVPPNEDSAPAAMPREVLQAKTAKILFPHLPWDDPNQVGPGGLFVGAHADELQLGWMMAGELVSLIRYA